MVSVRRRGLAVVLSASFILTGLVTAAPAAAATDTLSYPSAREDRTPEPSTGGLTSAAAGVVSGRLLFSTDALPSARPVAFGDVSAYRLDTVSGQYVYIDSAIAFDAQGDWSIADLPAGTYKFGYSQYGEDLSARSWHPSARFSSDVDPVELTEGNALDLGTVTIPTRLINTFRAAGPDRFETSAILSRLQFLNDAAVPVVIVNGLGYPDALSAGPLASAFGASMLMVTPTSIPAATIAELERLNPTFFVIVGGTGVVSAAVEAQLEGYASTSGDKVIRIAGSDRYATSRAVLEVGFQGLAPEAVLLATGRNYPDALAAGAAAGYIGGAVLLVDGAAPTLNSATSSLLTEVNAPVWVIGGTGSVSGGIADSIADLGLYAGRASGPDRFSTSVDIAIKFFFEAETAFLATGSGFADALAAGPLASYTGGPVYLTSGSCVTDVVWGDMIELLANRVYTVGGTGVLSSNVENLVACNGDTVNTVGPPIGETLAPVGIAR